MWQMSYLKLSGWNVYLLKLQRKILHAIFKKKLISSLSSSKILIKSTIPYRSESERCVNKTPNAESSGIFDQNNFNKEQTVFQRVQLQEPCQSKPTKHKRCSNAFSYSHAEQ